MANRNGYKPRVVCARSTKNHFLVAVSRPFKEGSPGFEAFAESATDVRTLKEAGSQVFVYPRENFDFSYDDTADTENLSEFVWVTAGKLGNMAVDTTLKPSKSRIAPADFIEV